MEHLRCTAQAHRKTAQEVSHVPHSPCPLPCQRPSIARHCLPCHSARPASHCLRQVHMRDLLANGQPLHHPPPYPPSVCRRERTVSPAHRCAAPSPYLAKTAPSSPHCRARYSTTLLCCRSAVPHLGVRLSPLHFLHLHRACCRSVTWARAPHMPTRGMVRPRWPQIRASSALRSLIIPRTRGWCTDPRFPPASDRPAPSHR
jgi:hypothetical protein